MARVLVMMGLIASVVVAGCASHRPAPPDPRPDDAIHALAGERGAWSVAHPVRTHARWIEPDWLDDHPVAKAAAVAGVAAGLVALVLGLLYLKAQHPDD